MYTRFTSAGGATHEGRHCCCRIRLLYVLQRVNVATNFYIYSRMCRWISMFKIPEIKTGNDGMPFDNVKLRYTMRRLHERMTETEFMKKTSNIFIYLFEEKKMWIFSLFDPRMEGGSSVTITKRGGWSWTSARFDGWEFLNFEATKIFGFHQFHPL